jgi:hypothetical protein
MAIVVVGGHTRNVGKTSVVAGLIAALPEFAWAAMKITQHGHGICAADGHSCECAMEGHAWAISEETDRSGVSDTSRFLLAGATPVWWARTEQGQLAEAMHAIREKIVQAENVILESNSVLKFLRPDLYLTVLDPAVADFKASAQEFLDRADGVVLHDGPHTPEWNSVSLRPVVNRPTFVVRHPNYVPADLVEFVRTSIPAKAAS